MNVQCTEDNRPMRARESRNINLMLLSEQVLELVSVFKEASRNFLFIFFKTRQAKIKKKTLFM
jgi:hypothetical protein